MNLISTLTTKWDTAIKEAFGVIAMYEMKSVVAFKSGGHDSLLATHLASLHPDFYGVVWADTGQGARQTRRYIRETCALYNWTLERSMVHPMAYEANIVQFGFPTPVSHRDIYLLLKSTAFSKALTRITAQTGVPRTKIAQVTGLRKAESTNRQGYVELYYERRNKKGKLEELRLAPLWDWSLVERDAMINHLGLVRNAFADQTGKSMECMCDANMSKGEREHRALIAPEYEELKLMHEELVAQAYRIQQKRIELGMLDEDDRVFLTEENLTSGWHLTHKLTPQTKHKHDPMNLCSGCELQRAEDGTGGYDPDLELHIAKINQAQKLLQIAQPS
jgi:3'-phosphoadenosine 5'-phosphosulfate sulfotransferase (PAPS reductase)/FAD synthetase